MVLSLHQPSPSMFSLLDKCLLMCRGRIVFNGQPSQASAFLLSAGLPCPQHEALAEHMMAAVSEPSLRDCLLEFVENYGPHLKVHRLDSAAVSVRALRERDCLLQPAGDVPRARDALKQRAFLFEDRRG